MTRAAPSKQKMAQRLQAEQKAAKSKEEALAQFELFSGGMMVRHLRSGLIGKVSQCLLSAGGLPEIWVIWENGTEIKVAIPEPPALLVPFFPSDQEYTAARLYARIRPGDTLKVGKHPDHKGISGRIGTVISKRFADNKYQITLETAKGFDVANLEAVEFWQSSQAITKDEEVPPDIFAPSEAIADQGKGSPEAEIKAITLHQPYASLIAGGGKRFETRHWYTSYRGKIAITAAVQQNNHEEALAIAHFQESDLIPKEIPFGAIVAIADLTDCIRMTEEFIEQQTDLELSCGFWEPGRFAWKLENVADVVPEPVRGKQGLWSLSPESVRALVYASPVDEEELVCESSVSSQASADSASKASDTPESAIATESPNLSKPTNTVAKSSTDTIQIPLFATTSNPSTANQDSLISSSAAPHAKTTQEPTPKAGDLMALEADFGGNNSESSKNPNPSSSSGKTQPDADTPNQDNGTVPSDSFSGALPRAGILHNGKLSGQPALERPISESASFLSPTPMGLPNNSEEYNRPGQDAFERTLNLSPTPTAGAGDNKGSQPSGNCNGKNLEAEMQPNIPVGEVSHPNIRENWMGFPPDYTAIPEADGGKKTGSSPLDNSPASSDRSLIEAKESQPLEMRSFPSALPSLGGISISSGVELVDPFSINFHPVNEGIYGKEDLTDLLEQIESSNWVKPIIVSRQSRNAVSGNRRLGVCRQLGSPVPVEWEDFADDDAELERLLLENASRLKTREQQINEANAWKPLIAAKAKARQLAAQYRNAGNPVPAILPELGGRETREVLAEKAGMKARTFDKASKVVEKINAETAKGNQAIAEGLRYTLNHQSVDAAYKLINQPVSPVRSCFTCRSAVPDREGELHCQVHNFTLGIDTEDRGEAGCLDWAAEGKEDKKRSDGNPYPWGTRVRIIAGFWAGQAGAITGSPNRDAVTVNLDPPAEGHQVVRLVDVELESSPASSPATFKEKATSSKTNEHYTPPEIIDAVLECFGGVIELDPFSNSHESPNVSAKKHFTKEDDGLVQPWNADSLFMNPPFSKEKDEEGKAIGDAAGVANAIDKLVAEVSAENVKEAILLTKADTRTSWFQTIWENATAICFVSGYTKFVGSDNAAPFAIALSYFGANVDGFYRAFHGKIGVCVQVMVPKMFGE
jgi:hypothetical protein